MSDIIPYVMVFAIFGGGFVCGFLFGGETVKATERTEGTATTRKRAYYMANELVPEDGHQFSPTPFDSNLCSHCRTFKEFHKTVTHD